MSLVEYASSDDEVDETNNTVGVKQSLTEVLKIGSDPNSIKSLFASLPEPKYLTAEKRDLSEGCEVKNLAKPSHELLTYEKKQKQPVKIFIPNINELDDDDIPKKKQKLSQVSSGLVDMLPAPKNSILGKAADKLVPYVLTKKPAKTSITSQNRTNVTRSSKSAPASKTLAATLVDYDDKDSDEDDNNETNSSNDFFSLKSCEPVSTDSSNDQVLNIVAASTPDPVTSSTISKLQMLSAGLVGYANMGGNDEKLDCSQNSLLEPCKPISIGDSSYALADVASEVNNEIGSASIQSISSDNEYSDAPLNFRSDWASVANVSNSKPQQSCKEYNVVHPSEQRKSFIITSEPPQETRSDVEVAKEIDITDERFLRLQGKKQRGKEDIQIIDICADQQLPSVANILMKNLTEEVAYKPSRKKGEMPTTQQRRKHQITYLAFQAKERELELKNQWSNNRLTRRQTQAKYGF